MSSMDPSNPSGSPAQRTCEALITGLVEYRHKDTLLEGYLAYRGPGEEPRPGVLVIHDWWGLGPYTRRRADQLAELGYVAFALDMYGKGVRPANRDEAGALTRPFKADREFMRARALAGLEVLGQFRLTDRKRLASIGYCFGGTASLELARSGADLCGVVSFHGNLEPPDPEAAKAIRAKVLVLHGADDPIVAPGEISAFQNEMRRAGVDWQMIFYGGAVHGFTTAESGGDPSTGVAYHERADKRSWQAMRFFFDEIFR